MKISTNQHSSSIFQRCFSFLPFLLLMLTSSAYVMGLSTCPDGLGADVVNIPSLQLNAGDTIGIREKAKKQLRIQSALEISGQVGLPDWVEVDVKKMAGVLKSLPAREDILPDINENLVVELYSK